MRLIVLVTLLCGGLVFVLMASEYNLDAIEQAKGENTKEVKGLKEVRELAKKSNEQVKQEYYRNYTLPREIAHREAEAKRAQKRETVGLSTKDCGVIAVQCEDKCKQIMFSDRGLYRCKDHCGMAAASCYEGSLRGVKTELCKTDCEVLRDTNGGVLSMSDRQKCYSKCEMKYHSLP